jgi:hypothetical protein
LACAEDEKTVALWDVAEGKVMRRLAACAVDGRVLLWDAGTGRELGRWPIGGSFFAGLAFSPDGTALASAESQAGVARIWEAATGKEIRRLAGQEDCDSVTFSPDGRLVATASGAWAGDATVRLCEALTGQEVRRFRGHFGGVQCVAFSPDGRSLAAGAGDATVLVWDVTGRPRPARLEGAELERLWSDLRGDADRAYAAVWRLAASPGQTLPLLRERLRLAAAADPTRVARLIANLASPRFAVRDRATRDLAGLGDVVRVELRRALDGQPPLEVRQRVERLLEQCGPSSIPSGEHLRALRAVVILEDIGTPEARKVLEELAGGAPEARLTQEARTALGRLRKRTADVR